MTFCYLCISRIKSIEISTSMPQLLWLEFSIMRIEAYTLLCGKIVTGRLDIEAK